MLNVNELISNCFQLCSLVGDGQNATGTQAMSALRDLNDLIAELNTQNYLLSNVQIKDITSVDSKIVVGTIPEGILIFNEEADIDKNINELDAGDICYCEHPNQNGYQYCWITENAQSKNKVYSKRFNDKCKELHLIPDVIVGGFSLATEEAHSDIDNMIDRVLGIGRKVGTKFVQLAPANKMKIDTRNKVGKAKLFSTEYENRIFRLNDREYHLDRFVIDFDTNNSDTYRITYLERIPDVKLTDTLYVDNKYVSMIEDGLCVKLCQRYKLMDIKADFENDFNIQKALIKRINNANQPMIYDGISDDWSDNYYNGISGEGW